MFDHSKVFPVRSRGQQQWRFMTPAPVLTKRAADLGWLASTPPDYPLRFAVEGATEAQAVENFAAAVKRWESIPEDVTN